MDAYSHWDKYTIDQCFADLASRFLVNIPVDEQGELRVLWQVEFAYWFYCDKMQPANPKLPDIPGRLFFPRLLRFAGIPYENMEEAYARHSIEKGKVNAYGCILLNTAMDKLVLVRGLKANSSWMLPRGKVNHEESPVDCAFRETWEETGYDCTARYDSDREPTPWWSVRYPERLDNKLPNLEADKIILQGPANQVTVYIIPDVPDDYEFNPHGKGEIGAISWFPIAKLPTESNINTTTKLLSEDGKPLKLFMVSQAIPRLTRWIAKRRKTLGQNRKEVVAPAPPAIAPPVQILQRPQTEAEEEERAEEAQSSSEVEEANKALNALFFGTTAAPSVIDEPASSPSPASITSVKPIVSSPPVSIAISSPTSSTTKGVLDDEERARQQAALFDDLLAISISGPRVAPMDPLQPQSNMLDSLFACASKAPGMMDTSPARAAASNTLLATLNRSAPMPQPVFTQPPMSHAPQQLAFDAPLQQSHSYPLPPHALPPHTLPLHSMPPHSHAPHSYPQPLPPHYPAAQQQMPLPPYPLANGAQPPLPPQMRQPNGYSLPPPGYAPAGMPFPPSFPPPPAFAHSPYPPPQPSYHSPPSHVVVSSAGPPLQPTPRRPNPIPLLQANPTPPPIQQPQASALLSLLNTGSGR